MSLPRPVFRFKEANGLTDYAKKEHYLSWLRHPVLGDPSFDTFEKLGETVHKSQPPYEWAVNGSLFRDPKDGACYLFAGYMPMATRCARRPAPSSSSTAPWTAASTSNPWAWL